MTQASHDNSTAGPSPHPPSPPRRFFVEWLRALNSEITLTLAFGAVGGIALWTWEWLRHDLSADLVAMPWRYLLPFALLGACSAVVSVFILSSADMRDKRRLVSLSVAAGFGFVLVIGNMLGDGSSSSLDQLTFAAAKHSTEPLGAASDDYAEKVVQTRPPAAPGPQGSPLEHPDVADILRDIIGEGGRILDGLGQLWDKSTNEPLRYGDSIQVQPPSDNPMRVERLIELLEPSIVRIEVTSSTSQDLMAVLFRLDGSNILAEQVAFNDDAASTELDPRLNPDLPAGSYVLRVLPFLAEPLQQLELKVTIESSD